jgi:O-antigen/teichoic acid export membrane protein
VRLLDGAPDSGPSQQRAGRSDPASLFPPSSERRRAGAPPVLRAFLALYVIAIPFAANLLAASKILFLVLLGPAWITAAIFIKIMEFAWVITFASTLFTSVVMLVDLQNILRYVMGGALVSLGLWAAIDVADVAALLWFLHASETRSTTCATPNAG